jgi:hypothetical protein
MDKQRLNEISRMMFVDGNSSFILVELLRDGFLKEGENVNLEYDLNGFALNGKKIPEPYNGRYLELNKKFGEGSGTGSLRCGGFIVKTELDEHGNPKPYACGQLRRSQTFQHIINMLTDDGLAGKTGAVAINIDASGVYVNGHLLTTPLEKVYERHILELTGFELEKRKETFSIVVKRADQ